MVHVNRAVLSHRSTSSLRRSRPHLLFNTTPCDPLGKGEWWWSGCTIRSKQGGKRSLWCPPRELSPCANCTHRGPSWYRRWRTASAALLLGWWVHAHEQMEPMRANLLSLALTCSQSRHAIHQTSCGEFSDDGSDEGDEITDLVGRGASWRRGGHRSLSDAECP